MKASSTELQEAIPHYVLAGKALLGLGILDVCVASYLILNSISFGFIDPVMMTAFGLMFVCCGGWMLSFDQQSQSKE